MTFLVSLTLLAVLGGAIAGLLDKPSVRYPSYSVSVNWTTTTSYYCNTQYTNSASALATAQLSPYWAANSADGNYLISHNGDVATQNANIQGFLVNFYGNPTGKQYVTASMQTIMDTLNGAKQKLASKDSAAASAMSSQITSCQTLQTQIVSYMNTCAVSLNTMYFSCGDNLYTALCQFIYQSSTVLNSIVVQWCDLVVSGA